MKIKALDLCQMSEAYTSIVFVTVHRCDWGYGVITTLPIYW